MSDEARTEDRDPPQCRRLDAEMAALERICHDDRARRELLWLRAKENGDDWSLRDLETLDPDVRQRVAPLEALLDPRAIETDRGRREAYGRLWDVCYQRHAGNAAEIP